MKIIREHLVNLLIVLLAPAIAVLVLFAFTGCRSSQAFSYYESGRMATAAYSEGMIEWSDGAGKIMPLGNISVNGVGVGK
jgi:hypothetical protein